MGGFVHICSSFRVKKGQCFLHHQDGGGPTWRRGRLDIAIRRWPKRIIRCAKCDSPATWIDHFYPYHSEMNRCDQCQKNEKGH